MSRKVVLSIKPEFANKIFDGTKQFEFRKAIFKDGNIKSVLVYASSPIQKVIGEFEINQILNHDLNTLWKITQSRSGITKDYFYSYFAERETGFAIEIKKVKKYSRPKCLKKDFHLSPPQSFAYYD